MSAIFFRILVEKPKLCFGKAAASFACILLWSFCSDTLKFFEFPFSSH